MASAAVALRIPPWELEEHPWWTERLLEVLAEQEKERKRQTTLDRLHAKLGTARARR